ncbi:MAG TPA: bifunctional phosphopantothenoylcysteine decarboxylase/phosphopantothenate--cysteine ligase CoaBC [Polyangiaceae bacterium]|jgi:phosphopantothenoylcysteine decarboxylase/phosphopantothenate--cysteine ligase|nr:bifunctional phosphopantothenoylcysteine decarboxylase/phosphopantothenate--cysteine ligase CoaBC [Polyangiaceae bacterium]
MPADGGVLQGRRITVGITGSIAAYKAVLLVRLLHKAGARVRVLMTESARAFVGESTLSGLTGQPVLTAMFDPTEGGERHVDVARSSDLVVIAPATADVLSRLASGRADDLLTATVLCARCPVLVAPAMHPAMWAHPATARNIAVLARDGVEIVGPAEGEVASGDHGLGRMLEPEVIAERIAARLGDGDLRGVRLVVTAGPTVEDVDPVRFIGNRSSGKMGFALAERAARRGADVTLIAGPVTLPTPAGVTRIDVRSALDMKRELFTALGSDLGAADALLMCAAVGDYRAERIASEKLKRKDDGMTLRLVQNPDLLSEVGALRRGERPVLVGFAVETGTDEEIVARARQKLRKKRVDVVIANHAAESMGRDDNRVLIVDATSADALPALPKGEVAEKLIDWLATRLAASRARAGKAARSKRSRRSPGNGARRKKR